MIGGPGVPITLNDPAVTELVVGGVGGKPQPVHSVTIVDAPPRITGKADQGWLWLAGLPVARRWEVASPSIKASERGGGGFDIRWTEPLTKAEFESVRFMGKDGKPVFGATEFAAPVWMADVQAGWTALSAVAIEVVLQIPADQKQGAYTALDTAAQTPGDHSRAALLRRAIKPETPGVPDFDPPALNTLAFQVGDQWAGAIGRLQCFDKALARQVARRMLLLAYLPGDETHGSWQPLWADADPAVLQSLLSGPQNSATAAAIGFMAVQPAAVAWVQDDAGLRDPLTRGTLSTGAAISLAEQPVVLSVRTAPGAGAEAFEPRAAKPLIGQMFTIAAGSLGAEPGGLLKMGTAPLAFAPSAAPVRATPPGVLIGPFSFDWSRTAFLRQEPVRVPSIAGSLVPAESGPGAGWTLYLERRAQNETELDREVLRVWVGPTGAPSHCVELTPTGNIKQLSGSTQAQVSRLPGGGGWCATVTIPASAVDDKGVLRLAVEHAASTGLRASWPRPMFPWQKEPGARRSIRARGTASSSPEIEADQKLNAAPR
ncbi:MAG: hypothetical protein QM783_08420 [Phycisphaerales bacterium]